MNFIPYKKYFSNKTKVILVDLETFFHLKWSVSKNIERFLSYMQKSVKTLWKSGFTRNAIISQPNKIFGSKFYTTIFKTDIQILSTFLARTFRTDCEITRIRPSRAGLAGLSWVRPGRAGPIHHGYRFNGQKQLFFVS